MSLVKRTLSYLQDRRDKLLNGGINSIPSPFVRFSSEFIGIEQGKYYIVTGSQKSGKTQLASYTFLYNSLLYTYNNPDKARLKVFYYSLEENPEDVTQRFMSFLLNRLSRIRVSPTDLQSTRNNSPLEQSVIDTLKDGEYKSILDFFEETVEFSPSRNPTGVYNEVTKFMKDNGTVHTKKKIIRDEFGKELTVEAFDYYEPNDPDLFVLVFFDHLSLVQPERGLTIKQTADKLSEYFVILRNRYKVSPVLIQQQSAEMESLNAFKENKLRPTAQGLADTKYSARDCNMLLGVFSPFKHELPDYKEYDITKLKDRCRFLEVILNRGGSSGGIIGLFFDGATCTWTELPKPKDAEGMSKVYTYILSLENSTKSFTMFTYSKVIKHLRSWSINFNFAGLKEKKKIWQTQ